VVLLAASISWATVQLRYTQLANTLKWLAIFLFAYVLSAIAVKPDWHAVAMAMVVPKLPNTAAQWQTLVAILGTTISPYLFFWQASQEVEEEKASGRRTRRQRRGATADEIIDRKLDVGIGTFFSNMVMFAIMVTTAATLHVHGVTDIETSRQAAEALRPIAGDGAALLYTTGIIGVGLLAIPTLSGSAAYALAEVFGWRQGLDEKAGKARAFYAVVLLATAAALILDFSDVNPVRALYWTAVINGLLAPVLLFGILAVAVDKNIMVGQPSSRLGRTTVAVTAIIMSIAAIAMFL